MYDCEIVSSYVALSRRLKKNILKPYIVWCLVAFNDIDNNNVIKNNNKPTNFT